MRSSPAGEELLRMIKEAVPGPAPSPSTVPPVASWAKDYPVGFGVPASTAAGGALGLLYHLVRKATDKKYRGSVVTPVAAGLGAGALGGLAYASAMAPNVGLKEQLAKEIETGKYDREGPFRQALRAIRPLIPSRPGTHDYPEDFKKNVKEVFTDLPDTVALGGKVAPNDTRIAVSSPLSTPKGLWREGFEGGKPRRFFSLDEPLTKLFGPPKDSSSYVGSETLGSRSQYDYNDATANFFGGREDLKQPAPLRPTDKSVTIGGHASSNPLSSVAGVRYVDILKQLAAKGHLKDVNDVNLMTCNTEGCDIPNDVVKAALGRMPQRVSYSPPGATSTAGRGNEHLRFIREPGADKTRLMDSELLAPRRITTVRSQGGSLGEEPSVRQTRVQPVIPTAATRWFADQADRFGTPVLKHFMKDPAVVGRSIRDATKIHDYVSDIGLDDLDYNDMKTWDTTKTSLPKLRAQFPKWFPNE